jgi:membrane-associated phospholipid phosphatase
MSRSAALVVAAATVLASPCGAGAIEGPGTGVAAEHPGAIVGTPSAEERPALRVEPSTAAALGAGALALWGASAVEREADPVTRCRWCEPGRLDRWAREQLRWRSGGAGRASDRLFLSVPLGSAAAVGWLAARDGHLREAAEDVLLVAAAIAIADPLTTGVKHATGRLRPGAWAAGAPRVEGDLHSFFSGHTSRVFAAAAAASQVTRLRGRGGSRWIAALGLGAAAVTGWLRVAADQHWATDVLAGAAAGAAVGWAVPTFALRPPGTRGPVTTLAPAPGGIAILF